MKVTKTRRWSTYRLRSKNSRRWFYRPSGPKALFWGPIDWGGFKKACESEREQTNPGLFASGAAPSRVWESIGTGNGAMFFNMYATRESRVKLMSNAKFTNTLTKQLMLNMMSAGKCQWRKWM